MATAVVTIDGRFRKRLVTVFKGHKADVGVLADKPHKAPLGAKVVAKRAANKLNKSGSRLGLAQAFATARFKSFAGGLARKTGSKSYQTVAEVSESLRQVTGINFYTRPWKLKTNREILKFTQSYVKLFLRKGVTTKQVENLLQAVVRNPILRGDYGRNTRATAKAKGFNRFMIDTAQLFQNITAKVSGRVQS